MLLVTPSPARADSTPMPPASFDCTKAPGVDEHVICSDPLLRQADHDLAAAYKAARSVATDKARLRADEHGWVIQRDQECGIEKFIIVTDANRPRFVDCFLDEYDERMGDLQQMSLRPTADPASISHPIRKSFDIYAPAQNTAMGDLQVLPGLTVTAFTWQLKEDNRPTAPRPWTESITDRLRWIESLVALAIAPDGSGALYSYQEKQGLGGDQPIIKGVPQNQRQIQIDTLLMIKRADIPKPDRFTTLCALNNGDILLTGKRSGPFGLVSGSDFSSQSHLPPDVQAKCNLQPNRLSLGNSWGEILNFGSLKTGTLPNPRFITLTTPEGTKTVEPPIRIDSRTHFSAYFAAGVFVLYQDTWPPGMNEIMERRWSKTNCVVYYEIDPHSATDLPYCIPFGSYSVAPPKPLVLPKEEMISTGNDGYFSQPCEPYFYVPGSGIWINDPAPSLWGYAIAPVPALVGFPKEKGCSIAYFDAPGSLKVKEWPRL